MANSPSFTNQGPGLKLNEYQELENEKRSFQQAFLAIGTFLVLASTGAAGIIVQLKEPAFLAMLPPAQLAIMAIYVFQMTMWRMLTAYLVVLEADINGDSQDKELRYEQLTRATSDTGANLQNPVFLAFLAIVLPLSLAILLEAIYGVVFIAQWQDLGPEGLRAVCAFVYLSLISFEAFLVGSAFLGNFAFQERMIERFGEQRFGEKFTEDRLLDAIPME